jgi:hypothetical protein
MFSSAKDTPYKDDKPSTAAETVCEDIETHQDMHEQEEEVHETHMLASFSEFPEDLDVISSTISKQYCHIVCPIQISRF